MTTSSEDVLVSFANEIGWKRDILAADLQLSGVWLDRVEELRDVYGRAASWSSNAVGMIEYKENGEKWLAEFKTFIDGQRIWRVYERVHPSPERPAFCIARRSADEMWDSMGYFNKWPRCWQMKTSGNAILRQLADVNSKL